MATFPTSASERYNPRRMGAQILPILRHRPFISSFDNGVQLWGLHFLNLVLELIILYLEDGNIFFFLRLPLTLPASQPAYYLKSKRGNVILSLCSSKWKKHLYNCIFIRKIPISFLSPPPPGAIKREEINPQNGKCWIPGGSWCWDSGKGFLPVQGKPRDSLELSSFARDPREHRSLWSWI